MKIAEVFYSVQGEGTLAGVPSVFIRTSGCNLRCVWCDTPYTSWSPEGEQRTVGEIADQVAGFRAARHAVITGGEPMMFAETVALAAALRERGYHITVETAGTLYLDVACDLMSISPKLANSTPVERDGGRWAIRHERLRYQPEVLRKLISQYEYQLKFVVSAPEDLEELERIVDAVAAAKSKVVLMPEGVRADVLRERARWLVEVCKDRGYRYSPRLHVDLWGEQRGK